MKLSRLVLILSLLGSALACGSNSNDNGDAGAAGGSGGGSGGGAAGGAGGGAGGGSTGGYTIGGRISGAPSTGVVLADPGEPDFTFANNATTFTFASGVAQGTAYNVTVKSVPSNSGISCAVTDGGTGTVGTSNVTSVVIGCSIQLP